MNDTVTKITTILILIGALHLGLVGAFGIDVITKLFGTGILPKVIYVLVGVSALMHLVLGLPKKLVK